jgi:polyribonucleotide nucleotidyltransferase
MTKTFSMELAGRTLSIEVGHVAKLASGSAWVRYADTVVLAAFVADKEGKADRDFFPLTVDYREKMYAAGRIPGGFFKREGRPTEKEILSSRLTDRALRPMFDKDFTAEVQVHLNVLSHDAENDSDFLALNAASIAVNISDVPFPGPIGAVRIGRINGSLVLNPTISDMEGSTLNLTVAGTMDSILMVEGGARHSTEDEMLEALQFAHKGIVQICELQQQVIDAVGKPKREIARKVINPELEAEVRRRYAASITEANRIQDKEGREEGVRKVRETALAELAETFPLMEGDIKKVISAIEKKDLRDAILNEGRRADGRGTRDIRQITCEIGVLPRTHGSAIFTRGQTQALVVTTLGTTQDEQKMDNLEGESWKSYLLHYNFPSYSVGEVRRIAGPGRREIGHGKLAERALEPVIPSEDHFPYTVRIVSDILESNGSSSMATVCGGSLALMDAGVPIQTHVSGVAMGLIKDGDKVAILSDILGVEDHLGDMDFKVTGTATGITALQMDMKIKGLDFGILKAALEQAKEGRIHILNEMAKAISKPRETLSVHAPRITILKINPDRIRDVIGPGGKMIRRIQEETGATIDIEDDGTVKVAARESVGGDKAIQIIRGLTEDPEVGRVYEGTVRRIVNFGAFVEILPNRDGLVHISELDTKRVAKVEDILKEGDVIKVKVIGIDQEGKVKLSRKAVLQAAEPSEATGV